MTVNSRKEAVMIDNNITKFSYAEIGSVGVILEKAELRIQRNVAMHMHMTYELHVLLAGEACIVTEQGEYMLETGDVALIAPHVYHTITNVTEQFQLYSISFQLYRTSRPNDPEEEMLHRILETMSHSSVVVMKAQSEIADAARRLIHSGEAQGLAGQYLTNTYTAELIIYIFRGFPEASGLMVGESGTSNRQTKAVQMERREIIETYISRHCQDATITELAQRLGVSEQHLRRFLRNHYGMSFSQLLNRQRINISKQLLKNTTKHISEIWQLAGFGSAQNFSIAFKKYAGMSASEYRERKMNG